MRRFKTTSRAFVIAAFFSISSALTACAAEVEATASAASAASGPSPDPAPGEPFAALPHAQPAVAFPTTADGLPIMQLGVGSGYQHPFINEVLNSSVSWAAVRSGGGVANMETRALYENGHLDPASGYPLSIPQTHTWLNGPHFRAAARYADRRFFAGTWVIDWQGDATIDWELRHGHPAQPGVVRADNRIELTFDDRAGGAVLRVMRIGPGGFSNLRIYRKEWEPLLDAGQRVTPLFKDHASRFKVIRTLDFQPANIVIQTRADQFGPLDMPGWKGSYTIRQPYGPRQAPPEVLVAMAVETDTALWMHFPGQAGAPAAYEEALLLPDEQPARDRANAIARDHAREIMASDEWEKIAARIVAALEKEGYPEDRRFYLEVDNEIWNNANPFWRKTHWFTALGEGLGLGGRAAYGYATARMALAFERALKDANDGRGRRQAWVPVLAGQHANPTTTRRALEGYRAFWTEHGADPAPWMKMAGVSTASYFSGALDRRRGFVTPQPGETFAEAFLREIRADGEGLAKRATDFIIGGPNVTATFEWYRTRRLQHEAHAKAFGAFFLGDYEGHDHDNDIGDLANQPDYIAWVRAWRYGPEGARLTREWVKHLQGFDREAIISKFSSVSAGHAFGGLEAPWSDGAYYGEDNERTKALKEYLREPAQ